MWEFVFNLGPAQLFAKLETDFGWCWPSKNNPRDSFLILDTIRLETVSQRSWIHTAGTSPAKKFLTRVCFCFICLYVVSNTSVAKVIFICGWLNSSLHADLNTKMVL